MNNTQNLPKDVQNLLSSSEAIEEKIANFRAELDAVREEIAEKSEPLLKPLREQTEILLKTREELMNQKHELTAKIEAVESQIADLQSQRVELGDQVEKLRLRRKNNNGGGLKEDITEAFTKLLEQYPNGVPLNVIARTVAEKRGSLFPNSARQGIEKYCDVEDGKVIGVK